MKNKYGFTLVELLAVLAVIGILAFIVLPNFIDVFNNANSGAMVSQENQMVDATKLFVEDYCRHPLSENRGHCTVYSLNTSDNRRYTCLGMLIHTGYIEEITSQGNTCGGFVVYDSDYKNYKAYLSCGDGAYKTEGIYDQLDASANPIINYCGG